MKIMSGYTTYMLDVELEHPDSGLYYTSIAVNFEDEDTLTDLDFDELMIQQVWEHLNYGHYYHEMRVFLTVPIDNKLYIKGYRYNGYDVEKIPTVIKTVVD